ncbi:PucR family transcriptional regulator [Herbiconiux sp. 11R-BC]|uniref:PucR family transcriptional regulator n=1 Tax=Herbiconiux sp. 11R-BC TaxID=3111637 RepID=UPI003C0989C0
MAATLAELLAQPTFGLRPLGPAHPPAVAISWAHGSDLDDPTPFLAAGQLLLTTGRQFGDWPAARFDDYVRRLSELGVVALGFGTEVVRDGTPLELERACRAHAMPLFEVPYRTPFIALARWVAEANAAEERARLDAALESQRQLSLAILGNGGLGAAAARAAERLACRVAVFDPDGEVIAAGDPAADARAAAPFAELLPQVRRLLRAGRRARIALGADDPATGVSPDGAPAPGGPRHGSGARDEEPTIAAETMKNPGLAGPSGDAATAGGGHAVLQTLGGTGRLRGVLVARRDHTFDRADLSVLTTLAALAEVSLEQAQFVRESLRALSEQLFELLLDGQLGAVRKATAALPVSLPEEHFVVVSMIEADQPPLLVDWIERQAASAASGVFVVRRASHLVLLVDEQRWPRLRRLLERRGATAGASGRLGWSELDTGLTQSAAALSAGAFRAAGGADAHTGVTDFADTVPGGLLGLLGALSTSSGGGGDADDGTGTGMPGGALGSLARARLTPVQARPDGPGLLRQAEVWLRHNGAWEPAARELGLHRHSLKARMTELGELLDLDVDRFADRAELWVLLQAGSVSAAR